MAYTGGIIQGEQGEQSQWALPQGNQPPETANEGLGDAEQEKYQGKTSFDNQMLREDSVTESQLDIGDSCIQITLERSRHTATKPDILEKELQWQQKGTQNRPEQDRFKEEILAQRHVRPFAIMCKNSPFLTICHSIAKFFGDPGDEEKGLHGKCMAFVGDRDRNREPQVVILPDEAWDWITPEVYVDYEALQNFYDAGNGKGARFFIPPPKQATSASQQAKKGPATRGTKKREETKQDEDEELESIEGKEGGDSNINKFTVVDIPRILYLPLYIFGEVCHKQYWTPASLLDVICQAEEDYDMQVENRTWHMMKKWCVAALQPDAPGSSSSHVALTVGAITQADESFLDWCKFRIDSTIGQRVSPSGQQQEQPRPLGQQQEQPLRKPPRNITSPSQMQLPLPPPPPAGAAFPPVPPGMPPMQIPPTRTHAAAPAVPTAATGYYAYPPSHDLATEVGRGIALGFQAFSNAGLLTQGAGARGLTTANDDKGKIYSPDAIAALKGFTHTYDIKDIQPIWTTFQTTKNGDVHRRHLQFGMDKWARDNGVELDRGIYFEQKSVEDIVNLRFNPGQGVAQFKSAERGLSLLICRTRTPEEIERVRDREIAEQETQATRMLEEALKLQRGDPRAPASNYFELKLNITTYCALLHTLFGDKCGYYGALMKIRNCLDTPGVYNIRQAYTPDICHRISWAIIDDGRAFFSTVMIQQDFAQPGATFPESLLESILPEVRYANQIMRANFPAEWKPRQVSRTIAATASQGLGQAETPAVPSHGMKGRANAAQLNGTDNRHPTIITLMAPYIAKFGDNIFVGELLDAGGKRLSDLPQPTGTRFMSKDGTKAYLCWNAVLGRCKFGKGCKYRRNHPGKGELTDEFAAAVAAMLKPAVDHVVATKDAPSPTKKVKFEPGVVTLE
jgi:hypothetical protein